MVNVTTTLLLACVVVVLCGGGAVEQQHVYKCVGRVHDAMESSVTVPASFMSGNATTTFQLRRKELNCKKGRFKVLLQTGDGGGDEASAKVLRSDHKTWSTVSYTDTSIRVMASTGYLRVSNHFFHPEEFCFDQTDATSSPPELSLFVCNPECWGQRPCVSKCCAQDQVWDASSSSCVGVGANEQYWSPTLFSRSVDNCVKRLTAYHREQVAVHLSEGLPQSCAPTQYQTIPLRKLHNLAFQRFRVLWTGEVIVRDKHGNWTSFQHGSYCVDGMVTGPNHTFTGEFHDQVLVVCPDQMPTTILKQKPIPLRYAAMLLGAAVILLVTALISCLLWDRQNVYEWTVSCEVVSMFFMILFVGVAHTIARRPEKSDFGSLHCVVVGAAAHFFWLATFCWLFIINFEIWWNFRSLVQLRETRKWFRFSLYQVVGWGCPFAVVLVGLLLDRRFGLQNEDLDCTDLVVPNYGQLNCYISKVAQGPYLFYPIGVVLVFNLLFYSLTVCKMWGYQRKSSAIIQYRSRGQTQPILIFLKLFMVMGVSWCFEILSWALTPLEADTIPLYWVVFDIVTLFQAISIFFLFVWKKEVLSRMWHKFPKCRRVLSPLARLPGCSVTPTDRERVLAVASLHRQQLVNTSQQQCSSGGGCSSSNNNFGDQVMLSSV